MISHFFPQVPFAQVVGAKKGVPNKPNPQSALQKLAQDIWVWSRRECIFLGDTKVDMETAVGAGMFPVGVLWGFRDREGTEWGRGQAPAGSPLGSGGVAGLTRPSLIQSVAEQPPGDDHGDHPDHRHGPIQG